MASQFRNVEAWQKGVALAVEIYRICGGFPRDERFGLVQRMRRPAVSIPSNVAEGRGRSTVPDYRNFIFMRVDQRMSWRHQIEIANVLGYLADEAAGRLIEKTNEVQRLLNGLIRSLEARMSP